MAQASVDIETENAPKSKMAEKLLDDPAEEPASGVRNSIIRPIQRLNNQTVLIVTAFLFASFVVAEIIGALASNSLSLLGDAAAMSVDVFTYFTNMYAEFVKARQGYVDEKTRLVLEVGIPSFSVCALLGVTGWITSDAIGVIQDGGADDDVDIAFLYGFAVANFVVDIISGAMFYIRGQDILQTRVFEFSSDSQDPDAEKKTTANLNMISALTHVGGDSLRTMAVFVAAVIATASDVPGSLCDAWAAVIVSITIVIAVIPLISEIYRAARHRPDARR